MSEFDRLVGASQNPAFDPETPQRAGVVPPAYETEADKVNSMLQAPPRRSKSSSAGAQIGAGVDTGQALAWEAASQLASYAGWKGSGFQEYAENAAKENMAMAEAVPALNLADQLFRGVGTMGVAVPAVVAGGIAGLLTPAATGTAGLMATGALVSAGLNLGDESFKAKEFDPNFEIDGADIAVNALLGGAELVPAMRMFKGLKTVAPALGKTFAESLKKAAPALAGTIASGAVTEGVQDFTTGAMAMHSTGTEITPERVDGLVSSMIDEAIVGGLLVGPIATIAEAGNVATMMSPERIKWDYNEAGEIVDFTYDAPTAGAAVDTGLAKGVKGVVSTLFGNATDTIGMHMPRNIPVLDKNGAPTGKTRMSLWQRMQTKIVQDEWSRGQMASEGLYNTTTDVDESIIKAELNRNATETFWTASTEMQNAARDDKLKGLRVATNPEAQLALDGIWEMDKNTQREAWLTKGLNFRPRGDTYVPSSPDVTKYTKDISTTLAELKEDLMTATPQRKALSESKADKYIEKVAIPYIEDLQNYQTEIVRDERSRQTAEYIQKQFAKVARLQMHDPKKAAALARKINNSLGEKTIPKIHKSNPLEQGRGLELASDEFLQKYGAVENASEQYFAHNNASALRIAHARKWGANNEIFHKEFADALTEAAEQGMPISAEVLAKSTDLLAVMQKQPIRKIGATAKKAMENIRVYENITKLPLAIIPSIAETFFVFDKYGTVSGLTAIGKAIDGGMRTKASKRRRPSANQKMLDSLGMSMEEAVSNLAARMGEDTFSAKKIENKFFNVTLLPQFTEGLRMVAAFQAEKSIQDAADVINNINGKSTPGMIQRAATKLYQAGLNPNDITANFRQGDSTKFSTDPNSYYMKHIRPATIALAEDIVVHPTPSKKPLWHSDPRLMLVSHMKSFSTVFTNSVMKTWYRNMKNTSKPEVAAYATKLFPVLAFSVATQASLSGLREWIRTGDTKRWSEQSMFGHTMTGASYMGMVGMGAESIHQAGWGRSTTESWLGPAAGEVSNVANVLNLAFSDPAEAVNLVIQKMTAGLPAGGLISDIADKGLTGGN